VTRKGALVALGFPFNVGDSVAQFQPLNVVEILKFDLSGLVFLFALLSFWLFYAEQKRDPPRPKMLGCILMFSLLNLEAEAVRCNPFGAPVDCGARDFQSVGHSNRSFICPPM
jgi:hypothetical protein